MWVGREWNGIRSQNKCFFLWGGRAFLDQGWRGQKILLKRAWKDRLLGYRRTYPFSLISDQDYLDALEKIVQFRPDYIMGHSSIVERFAFVNRACASELRLLHLKGVVLSAEMLNSPYSARVIEEVFGCPVIQEYGAAEVDVMAYSTPQGYFSAFWNNHFLEILPSNDEKGGELLVTSLFPRCCPIIRYRIGDTIQLLDEDDGIEYGISRFKDIGGRVLDFLLMPDGQKVFAYIFPFVVRDDYELISRLQVVQSSQGYRMDVQSPVESLPEKVTDEMRRKLGKLHPDLSAIEIRVVKQLHQTERGKTPLIWREEIPSMNSAASSQIPVRDMGRSL
jgi:phenylacetate-CoA ligase